VCYSSQNLVSGRFLPVREKKLADSVSFLNEGIINLCIHWRLYTGGWQTPQQMHVLGERSSPVQTKGSYRPTCRAFDNNAEAIIINVIVI